MMRFFHWQILLGIVLIILSVIMYVLHFAIFHDLHHIFIYLLGDIAFVPIEVLLVTLIIHRLLSEREKRSLLKKMNMVIGSFFSEVGVELLRMLSSFHQDSYQFAQKLIVNGSWTEIDFNRLGSFASEEKFSMDSRSKSLEDVKRFLVERHNFLLSLLGNPNLLEHDSFTEMLWAVFHLTNELKHRNKIVNLSDNDYNHLSGDIQRAYVRLIGEWLAYMKHLKNDYPYLFSLAVRTNPFDPEARPEIP
ncbi:MAG TPA: hypothetical protein VMZ04_08160 [Anaerolineae bacterium]|nr:hypothetical protein [Anaerolineae bacterium]